MQRLKGPRWGAPTSRRRRNLVALGRTNGVSQRATGIAAGIAAAKQRQITAAAAATSASPVAVRSALHGRMERSFGEGGARR